VGAPTGTVTFLFTDIEGSTRVWEAAPEAMRVALARHDAIVRAAIEAHDGYVFATGGDGFAAAFARPAEAVGAAQAAQVALDGEAWPDGALLRVRMGLHTGVVEERNGDYFGPAVNRAARIMAAGHGGQVLVSAATAALMGTGDLSDLGEHAFAGLEAPEHVYQVGAARFAPLRSLGAVPSNLSTERSVFVGRERELAVVAGLVRSERLVTLTGVGGVGKTRLAVQAAAGLVGEFPGGVWLVELAPLVDAALVATAVASALRVSVAGSLESTEAVCRFLAPRRALVVLDNCEHVIDAAATFVDRALAAAPRVRVLATSREALDVAGERTWRVPSLSLDGDGGSGDAVALFTDRAAQAQPGFSLSDQATQEAALAVCRRLDGIPLAIELAAARAKVLSVDQIAAHLDERFRLLTRGGRTAVARQQTLQGAIDWSYELLSQAEQVLFATLGVFAGEFDLPSVAAVAGLDEFEALDLVESLAAKSMIEADPARNRYRLLETLRQYAWERLVDARRLIEVRDAHATRFSDLTAEQAKRMGEAGEQIAALDRLEADYDNLRAALAWLIEQHRAEDAARMARRLVSLFNIRHPREGLAWFEQVTAIAGDLSIKSRTRLLGDTAYAAMNAGDGAGQYRYATEAVELSSDDAPAVAYYLLGSQALQGGSPDFAAAVAHLERAIATSAAAGDLTTQTLATSSLIQAAGFSGDILRARQLIPQAIALAERLGHPTMLAVAYGIAGATLARISGPDEARPMFERAVAHAEAGGGPIVTASFRSSYALTIEDARVAARTVQPAIPLARAHMAGYQQSPPLLVAAKIAAATGDERVAARLLGAFSAYSMRTHNELPVYERLVARIPEVLGAAVFDDEFGAGTRVTIDQALQVADEVVTTIADGPG
jgi:predicted ATPase/class 3 adenylate cyclase